MRRARGSPAGRVVDPTKFDVVEKGFYSPVPDVHDVGPDHFDRPHGLRGIELDLDAQMRFIEEELAAWIVEFAPPPKATGVPGEYFVDNGVYASVDGDVLYAMARHLPPRQVIELGSGHSTLVLARAARDNAATGTETHVTTIDPYRNPIVPDDLEGLAELRAERAQDVPLEEFEALGEGDVLFVDTSHVAKTGSDVNFVILDVLPALAPGVYVHFHDIFLPYEYHRHWVENGPYWNEQYLLQAFLALNPHYEVVLANHALLRTNYDRLRGVVPSLHTHQPSAFWIRRRR